MARTDQHDRRHDARGRRHRRDTRPGLPFPYNLAAWVVKTTAKALAALAVLVGVASIRLTWRTLRLTVLAALALGVASTSTRWRHHIAPLWVLTAALACTVDPVTGWAWVVAGLVLVFLPEQHRDRLGGLSAREQDLVGRGIGSAGLVITAGLPFPAAFAALTGTVLAAAVPWWRGRRVRPPHPAQIEWDQLVAGQDARFAGTWIEPVGQQGMGVLRLHNCLASDVARLDEQAEWLLTKPRGSVIISADPRLTVRDVRIAFSNPGDKRLLRFWEGPSMRPDGTFLTAYADGTLPLYGRGWREDGGATFVSIVAAPGSGKGSILRVITLELLYAQVLLFGACGKRGGGLGYLRPAFVELATRPDEWVDLIWSYLCGVRERATRYGDLEADSFIPTPGEPRMALVVDELHRIIEHEPRVAGWIREITGSGRSLGMGTVKSLHKGDGRSYGDTETRSNVLDGGWTWVGPMTDGSARTTALQGYVDDVDPHLPDEPGWCNIVGRVLPAQPVTAARQLWVPNARDLEKALHLNPRARLEDLAPFGTVEDWLAAAPARPVLNPATADAMGVLLDAHGIPVTPTTQHDQPSTSTDQGAPVGPLEHDAPVRVTLQPPPTRQATGRERILEHLADGTWHTRAEISAAVHLGRKQTSTLLAELESAGAVRRDGRGSWARTDIERSAA